MRVLFADDFVLGSHAFRGIGTYARALRASLTRLSRDKELHFSLANQDVLEKPDLIHYPHADLFFRTLFPPKETPFVVTLHDVIPLLFPKKYPPGIKGFIRLQGQKGTLRKASAIITDSLCSKNDIVKHLRIAAEKVFVVPLAANETLLPQSPESVKLVLDTYHIKRPYFLYVGDMNYNKNVVGMVRAFHAAKLHAELVLVGRNLNNTSIPEGKELAKAIYSGTGKIKVLSDIPADPPEILASLFSGAQAYVQPSYYEGFGLSVLDAFRCRCPVMSSSTASLPEVYGDAALSFDPWSEKQIQSAFERAYAWTKAQREHMIHLGVQQEKKFTWMKTGMQTIAVYQEILKKRKHA